MDLMQIDECLKSMTILIDTREQPSERAERRYKSFSCPYRRQKLDYGDYSATFLLNGSETQVKNAIERKMSLDELSNCFTRERERFKREFERAKEDGAVIYLLVENATWENLYNGNYRTKYNSKAFVASLIAWMTRYDLKPIFCKAETSGKLIQDILYRELKQKLEEGFYG